MSDHGNIDFYVKMAEMQGDEDAALAMQYGVAAAQEDANYVPLKSTKHHIMTHAIALGLGVIIGALAMSMLHGADKRTRLRNKRFRRRDDVALMLID